MNQLSYIRSDDNGLSFELLIDGKPLGDLVGARDTSIPYWIFEDDLPRYPPSGSTENPLLRIVAVCSCGEYGCGHAQCEVARENDEVHFRNFDFDVTPEGRKVEFRFSLANYDEVVSSIIADIHEYRSTQQAVPTDRA